MKAEPGKIALCFACGNRHAPGVVCPGCTCGPDKSPAGHDAGCGCFSRKSVPKPTISEVEMWLETYHDARKKRPELLERLQRQKLAAALAKEDECRLAKEVEANAFAVDDLKAKLSSLMEL